jgi:hypothetical protein
MGMILERRPKLERIGRGSLVWSSRFPGFWSPQVLSLRAGFQKIRTLPVPTRLELNGIRKSFGATQALLSKHLAQVAAIDTAIGKKFVERAEAQNLCQTEHQRLIALFMNDQSKAEVAEQEGLRGLFVEEPQMGKLAFPYLNPQQAEVLRVQLAAAPPHLQGTILRERVERAVVAIFQSLVKPVADSFMLMPFATIVDTLQDEDMMVYKLVGTASSVVRNAGGTMSAGAADREPELCPTPFFPLVRS